MAVQTPSILLLLSCFLLPVLSAPLVNTRGSNGQLTLQELLLLQQILGNTYLDLTPDFLASLTNNHHLAATLNNVWDAELDQPSPQDWSASPQPASQHLDAVAAPISLHSRQHWTENLRPGGKRDRNDAFDKDAGKHWSDQLLAENLESLQKSPESWEGMQTQNKHYFGREDLERLANLADTESFPLARQHWSFGLQPGGRRSESQGGQHVVSKRQHWSTGYAPGGKRSVDLTSFDVNGRKVARRSIGMQEEVFKMEQPKPIGAIAADVPPIIAENADKYFNNNLKSGSSETASASVTTN